MADKETQPLSALIERRNIKLADEARKAQSEANAFKILAKHWPADRQLTQVYHSGSLLELGEVYCSAMVRTREEALEYLTAFDLQPLTYFSGHGVSAIRVSDWLPAGMAERYENEVRDIFPVYWRYSDWVGATLIGYTVFDDMRVSIKISIKDDPARRQVQYSKNQQIIASWQLINVPGGGIIKFAGTAQSCGDVQVYFFKEAGGAAPTVADLMLEQHYWQSAQWR